MFDQGFWIVLVVAYTYSRRRIKSIESRFCETEISIMVDVNFSFCFAMLMFFLREIACQIKNHFFLNVPNAYTPTSCPKNIYKIKPEK